jgi:hypothetical protein
MKRDAIKYLGSKCFDCGDGVATVCFEFHHVDPSEKEFNLSDKTIRSWERMKDELDKCILLCSNCHKLRHNQKVRAIEAYLRKHPVVA